MYGTLVIAYLFLGGASAGAFFVMCAWSLWFHHNEHRFSRRMRLAFKSLLARCCLAASLLLAAAIACLVFDLGTPHRALLMFFKPHPTLLTLGAWSLGLEPLLGALLAAANMFDKPHFGGRGKKALEIACCLCSLVVMAYTGAFLASTAIPLWHSWTLVGLFFFSALSTGFATVLLIDYTAQDRRLLLCFARPLQKSHIACLLCEAAFLALFAFAAASNPEAACSVAMITQPGTLATALAGVVGFGIVVPLVCETFSLRRMNSRGIPVADAICLVGGLMLRWLVVGAERTSWCSDARTPNPFRTCTTTN